MSARPDWSVYLVTDPGLVGDRDLGAIVRSAIRGGVTAVQLRDKHSPDDVLAGAGRRLLAICREMGASLVVNDRVEIAIEIGADGAHVGQDDMPAEQARRLLGPGAVMGVSVSSVAEAVRAVRDGATYLGISPVFETPTKPDAPPAIGLDGVAALRASVAIPIVAIGGIDASNAALVIRCGADGVAVVRAIMAAPDTEAAAREIAAQVKIGLAGR